MCHSGSDEAKRTKRERAEEREEKERETKRLELASAQGETPVAVPVAVVLEPEVGASK
jgi:hypothetical protein